MKNLYFFLFVILIINIIACATIRKEPMSYKEFQINNETLEDVQFTLKDVYFVGLNMTTKMYANGEDCYVMAISNTPPSKDDIAKTQTAAIQLFLGGGGVFLPIKNKELLSKASDFKSGDKITIIGIGSYPYMKVSALAPAVKYPNSTLGIFAQDIKENKEK